MYRRLGGPRGRFARARKNPPPPPPRGFYQRKILEKYEYSSVSTWKVSDSRRYQWMYMHTWNYWWIRRTTYRGLTTSQFMDCFGTLLRHLEWGIASSHWVTQGKKRKPVPLPSVEFETRIPLSYLWKVYTFDDAFIHFNSLMAYILALPSRSQDHPLVTNMDKTMDLL